jgi:hypothetical protein
VNKSKIYYLAPAYPAVIAGGAILLEHWVLRKGIKWLKPAFISFLVIGGILMAPMSVPILNIDTTEKYVHTVTFGAFKNIYELTGDLRGMFGWKKRVETVADVYHGLSPGEQQHTIILAAGYGNAGAIDYLGKAYGLPNAVSLSMTYWLWGLPKGPFETVIAVGFPKETMEKIFHQVELAAEVELENVNPWQTPFTVTVCRKPKVSLKDLWKKNRPW